YQNGRFETFATEAGRRPGFVKAIAGDEAGRLWLLIDDRVLQWADGRLADAGVSGFPVDSYNGRGIERGGPGGGFWSSNEKRLSIFLRGVITDTRPEGAFSGKSIYSVAMDRQGRLWVSAPNGVAALDHGTLALHDSTLECMPGRPTQFVNSPEAT